MRKPDEIVDRDDEWRSLEKAWQSSRPELVFVIGRRRVGKSFLLAHFARQVKGLYYQATRRTEAEQLDKLSRIVGAHFDDPALRRVSFPDWEALFTYITERAAGSAFLLVLDEFPYLTGAAPALPSILQDLWDHSWPGTKIKVVLSGSHISAMSRFEAADQPLYGRRTARLAMAPMAPTEVPKFLPGASPRDQLITYGIYGGLPGHLDLIDPDHPVDLNVAEHLLTPSGRLADEAQHMLDAFLGDADVHYSIIEAIATGHHTWKGITSRLGKESGSLSRPLRWLREMEIVRRVVPVTEARPETSKRALYRISDPYVAFWHRFVSPLLSQGILGLVPGRQLWDDIVVPGLDDYMGPVFEEACRGFAQTSNALPFRPLRVGEWWDSTSENQIDVVALDGDGRVLLGECKWGRMDGRDLAKLRASADLVIQRLGGVRTAHLAVFTGREIDDPVVARAIEAGEVLHFAAPDLVGEALDT